MKLVRILVESAKIRERASHINSDLIVGGNTIIDLGAGQIKGPGTLASATGNFDLTAGTVTVNSVTTANNITIKALDGNINLGQLRSSGSDGKISLTVQAGNIVNQNNGYIEADQLVILFEQQQQIVRIFPFFLMYIKFVRCY